MSKIAVKVLKKPEVCDILSNLLFTFVFLERVDDVRFEQYEFDKTKEEFTLKDGSVSPISDWDKVIAFSNDYELRLKRIGDDECKAIVITDDDTKVPLGWDFRDVSDFENNYYKVFLWGSYDNNVNCWIEGRIPRFLHYPLDPKTSPSPMLKVMEYYNVCWEDDSVKEERYYRFVDLY